MHSNTQEAPTSNKTDFAYTISFTAEGEPSVLDAKGRPAKARRVCGPIKADKIVRVRTMSIVEAEGSHYIVINLDGALYQIDLPHFD